MDRTWLGAHEKAVWAVVGIAITVVVAFVVYSFVGSIVVGVFLYYALRPVYRWLDERFEHPDLTATVTLLTVGLPMLLVLAYAGFVGVRQLDQFLAQSNLEQYRQYLQPYVDVASVTDPRRLLAELPGQASRLLSLGTTVLAWGFRIFLIFTVAFYLLRDDHKISAWFRDSFGDRYGAVEFLEAVDDDLTTIYTGNLITIGISGAIAVAVYYGLDLVAPSGTGVAFPLLLGLVTGVATLIPAIGMKLVWVPYAAYLFWQSFSARGVPLWFPVAFTVTVFLIVDSFPDLFIRSYVSKGDLHMGLILLAYALSAGTFGWYGVFLGPILLVLFLHFARGVFPNLLRAGSEVVSE